MAAILFKRLSLKIKKIKQIIIAHVRSIGKCRISKMATETEEFVATPSKVICIIIRSIAYHSRSMNINYVIDISIKEL